MSILSRLVFVSIFAACAAQPHTSSSSGAAPGTRRPNIVYILADDLGYGELGCYGQTKIETPNLDALAAAGMRFTQHYSGSCVCAPTRAVLLTGKHTGNAYVRDNHEVGGWKQGDPEGQMPLPPDTFTIGRMLQGAGYATACIGKWGLGGPGSTGVPSEQGFDHFFGYLCQRHAHNYYPTHLWRNEHRVPLPGNAWKNRTGAHYSPDLLVDEALDFVDTHADEPFFLYFATPVPHLALQAPEESIAEYRGRWPEEPYDGSRGYLPHPTPRAAYAAMVTRMDRDVGRILRRLDDLGIADDTIVMFASDNGPTFDIGGADSPFFDSAPGMRGLKCSLHEGGIRVPFVARWPGRIPAGSASEHVCAAWDVLPTIADLVEGAEVRTRTDGISIAPTLLANGDFQPEHPSLYWEYHARSGSQAARIGRWKGIRKRIRKSLAATGALPPIELYDLETDLAESRDRAADFPAVVAEIRQVFEARTPSHHQGWNFVAR